MFWHTVGRWIRWIGVTLLIFAWGLSACSPDAPPPAEIRIGLVAYLQGEYIPHTGVPTVNAANLAVDPVNAAGGLEVNGQRHPVRLIVESISNNPEQAVAAVQRLINLENVVAVVGPQFSPDAIPAAALAQDSQVPLIAPLASNREVTLGRDYVFRMTFVDDFQGSAIAHVAYQELGARRAGVLYDVANIYCRGIAEVFQQTFTELGGEVVASEVYVSGDRDFSVQLERIQSSSIDILLLPNYSEDVRRQGEHARRLGIDVPFIGGDGWSVTALGRVPAFDGSYYTTQWAPDAPDPLSQAFVESYQAAYKRPPNNTAALTYDTFQLLFLAIQSQGSFTPQAIQHGLYALDPYLGVGGTIDFTDTGDPVKDVMILQIKDKKAIFYTSISP